MDIIIPCAGQSTRFPNMRPKYLLCDYLGRSMIQLSAEPYLKDHTVHVVILQEHEDQYNVTTQLRNMFGTLVNVVILPNQTSGPADTICQALSQILITDNFLVKDCDSVFDHERMSPGNKIYVDSLAANPSMRIASNKSYVTINEQGIVSNVVEKKIISDMFCVGGYQFESAKLFIDTYNNIKNSRLAEIYMSDMIDAMIVAGTIFVADDDVYGYNDLGALEDWEQWNNKPSLFVDIDGTIVENQSLYGSNNYRDIPMLLTNNIDILLQAKNNGAQIIFTTSRPRRFEKETKNLLSCLGFGQCQLLMDMHHAKRILINDFAPTNSYPSAIAINLPRNSDTLADQLGKLI